MARDHDALDLGRALADFTDLCIPHEALDGIVLGVAVATVYLHRFDRGSHRKLRAEELRHCCFLAEWLSVLSEPGRVKHEVLTRLDLRRHVGELELDPLKVGDRLTELSPLARVT